MNYCNIKKCDIADGPGVRVSLFVSGCRNHCPGCFNKETWDFNAGEEVTTETLGILYEEMSKSYVNGLTVLGGDPFEPENIEQVRMICQFLKSKFPDKTIWLYTGYKFEDFKDDPIMQYLDVLVDGRFVQEKKDLSLRFRGSSNQRLIDVQKSLKSGKVVEWVDKDYEERMKQHG